MPLEQIVAHFNVDMIRANRRPGSADKTSSDVSGPGEVFVIGPGVLSVEANALLERGILTIGVTTGMHDRYHLPADEAQHLDPEQMQGIARLVLTGAWMLANSDERPRIDRPLPESVLRVR